MASTSPSICKAAHIFSASPGAWCQAIPIASSNCQQGLNCCFKKERLPDFTVFKELTIRALKFQLDRILKALIIVKLVILNAQSFRNRF